VGLCRHGLCPLEGHKIQGPTDKVGIKKEGIENVFNGSDGPIVDKTADFIKSIPAWKAKDPDTLVAYEMNGQPLSHFKRLSCPHRRTRLDRIGWDAGYGVNTVEVPADGGKTWLAAKLGEDVGHYAFREPIAPLALRATS